jgi:hypothetical protein
MAAGDFIVLRSQRVAAFRLQPAGLHLRLSRCVESRCTNDAVNPVVVEGDCMSAAQLPQAIESLPLSEHAWQAWLEKNRKAEQLGFEKRMKIGLMISPLLLAALLFWLFKGA